MSIILDGKTLAQSTEKELAERVLKINNEKGFVPILATILVGSDPASGDLRKDERQCLRKSGNEIAQSRIE